MLPDTKGKRGIVARLLFAGVGSGADEGPAVGTERFTTVTVDCNTGVIAFLNVDAAGVVGRLGSDPREEPREESRVRDSLRAALCVRLLF